MGLEWLKSTNLFLFRIQVRMMLLLKVWIVFYLMYCVSSSTDILLEPIKRGQYNVALVFLPGAELPPERYVPLAKQVQTESTQTLWVGIPAFIGDLPFEQTRPQVIAEILGKLNKLGMPNDAQVFLGGHSLGGISSQTLAIAHANQLLGQVLIGSFIERKHRSTSSPYPVSTLILSGELDGLARVTRIVESFYFYSTYPHFTLIIPGMNHMDTASGTPSSHIVKNDISSEINQTSAHQELALRMSDYFDMRLNNQTITSYLEKNLNATQIFAQPFIDALKLEGFYHFTPPCDNQKNDPCQLGSSWTEYGQVLMSNLNDTVRLNITDEFHVVYKPPEHFAHLDNNCSTKPNDCTLYVHTVTQNIYDFNDNFDTGETHTSAEEMRTKLISRQVMLQAADGQKRDFNETDNQSLCGFINQHALDWALANAPKKTLERYQSRGKQMIIGDDIGPLNAGPLWIWTPLVSDSLTLIDR